MTEPDDPYGDWLKAYLLESERPAAPPAGVWWIWARVLAGVAVMSTGIGASISLTPGPFTLLAGWLVATAAGVNVAVQTLDQTEE